MVFYRFKNPDAEVRKKFQIQKIPSLMVMYIDDMTAEEPTKAEKNDEKGEEMKLRVATYNGKYVYNDLKHFFDSLVSKPV